MKTTREELYTAMVKAHNALNMNLATTKSNAKTGSLLLMDERKAFSATHYLALGINGADNLQVAKPALIPRKKGVWDQFHYKGTPMIVEYLARYDLIHNTSTQAGVKDYFTTFDYGVTYSIPVDKSRAATIKAIGNLNEDEASELRLFFNDLPDWQELRTTPNNILKTRWNVVAIKELALLEGLKFSITELLALCKEIEPEEKYAVSFSNGVARNSTQHKDWVEIYAGELAILRGEETATAFLDPLEALAEKRKAKAAEQIPELTKKAQDLQDQLDPTGEEGVKNLPIPTRIEELKRHIKRLEKVAEL